MRRALVFVVLCLSATGAISQAENNQGLFSSSLLNVYGFGTKIDVDGQSAPWRYVAETGIVLDVSLNRFRMASLYGELTVAMAPIQTSPELISLVLLKPSAGLNLRLPLGPVFALHGIASGGYGAAWMTGVPNVQDSTASGFFFRVGAGASAQIGQFSIRAEAAYESFLHLVNSFNGRIAAGWTFDRSLQRAQPVGIAPVPQPLDSERARLEPNIDSTVRFRDVVIDPLFPILYKYYDDHPFGSAVIVNTGDELVADVEVRLNMAFYIDSPKLSATVESLEPGEQRTVDLYALFNDNVLSITEGDKVAATLEAEYRLGTGRIRETETVTVDFYDRNSLRWDDDRKVASFVTARDPEVQAWAKNLASVARRNRRDAISTNLQLGLMMYTGMVDHGMAYVIDPNSPYESLSQDPLAVDFVQFPRQTLDFRAGDCDDLSVCYAAMLESIGISTAFVTIPGHIFSAFKLDMDRVTARSTFLRPDDLIYRGDEVWVPVEITLLEDGFLKAWSTGARKWREYDQRGEAGFYPTADAWGTFAPVAFSESASFSAPPDDIVRQDFVDELNSFVRTEMAGRELDLRARIQRDPDNVRDRNRLGLLFARYGLYDEAADAYEAVLEIREDAVALINLGNLAFLAEELLRANDYFLQALEISPDHPIGLLGTARVNHERGNYGSVLESYSRLKEVDPGLAVRFSYLDLRGDDSSRASDSAQMADTVEWAQEGEQ